MAAASAVLLLCRWLAEVGLARRQGFLNGCEWMALADGEQPNCPRIAAEILTGFGNSGVYGAKSL